MKQLWRLLPLMLNEHYHHHALFLSLLSNNAFLCLGSDYVKKSGTNPFFLDFFMSLFIVHLLDICYK